MRSGSLTIVGTGILPVAQTTTETYSCIKNADKVLYLVLDELTEYWIRKLNSTSESLHSFYKPGKDRLTSYLEMVERIIIYVRAGLNVCVAFYGHPGLFVYPSHEAIKRARIEGFKAKMLPGISSEACLFAELGIDPASTGYQGFEATDFLIYKRKFDLSSSLILWQIGVIGDLSFNPAAYISHGLKVLIEYLQEYYPSTHEVTIYEASQYPICASRIHKVPLMQVPQVQVTQISTMYVPPKEQPSLDHEMLSRLGLLHLTLS